MVLWEGAVLLGVSSILFYRLECPNTFNIGSFVNQLCK